MRVLHILPMIHDEASGPVYVVFSLCDALARRGDTVKIASFDSLGNVNKPGVVEEFERKPFPGRLGRAPDMAQWLKREISAGSFDIVHNNGLWMMPNVYGGFATKKAGVPYVVSPHGSLSQWAMKNGSARVKQVFWRLKQRPSMDHTALFHATSQEEYADIRRFGFKQPVAVIPSGVDVLEGAAIDKSKRERKQLLYLSRIHPGKGIEHLLRAWKLLSAEFPDWDLRVVGPDNDGYGYADKMKALATELSLVNFEFHDGLFGDAKVQAYRDADLYVLPTFSENFGITIAEALAQGTPVMTTKGAPWEGLERTGSGWWIDVGFEPLLHSLRDALCKDAAQLMAMGGKGREWMRAEFDWNHVAMMMSESYRYAIEGGAKPDWVFLD